MIRNIKIIKYLAIFVLVISFGNSCSNKKIVNTEDNIKEEKVILRTGDYTNVPNPNIDYYKDCTLVKGNYSRLTKLIKKAKSGENISIVGLGGSITAGGAASPKKDYGSLVAKWFRDTFPETRVFYINKGIGATGSIWGAERVERDVLELKPDLVLVEFSVNDADTPFEKEAYESMLRKILEFEPQIAVLHIANVRYDFETGEGTNVQDMHAEICEHYGVPVISMKNGVYGKLDWTEFIPDTIHPNDLGHEIMASLVMMKLSDIMASLDAISEKEYPLPDPITNDGFRDCIYIPASDIEISSFGDWEQGNELICTKPGGDSLIFETDYSYLMLRYVVRPETVGKIKIIVDGNEKDAKYLDGYFGMYFQLLLDVIYDPEPKRHRVEIVMENGNEFDIVGIYASNFVKD